MAAQGIFIETAKVEQLTFVESSTSDQNAREGFHLIVIRPLIFRYFKNTLTPKIINFHRK